MKIAVALKTSLAAVVLASSFALPAAAHGPVHYISYYYDTSYRPVGHDIIYCDGHVERVGDNGPVIQDVLVDEC